MHSSLKLLLCLAVFLGSSLLFLLEPLTGKLLVPIFGGTSGVWSICLLFFQLVVLVGYFFTLWVSRLSPRCQSWLYALLFAASSSLAFLQCDSWICTDFNNPQWELIGLLIRNLAAPCILLCTVSGMMQVWFNAARLGNAYPLYSLSNLGSLVVLFAFPFFLEPAFTNREMIDAFGWLYLCLAGLICISSLLWLKNQRTPVGDEVTAQVAPAESGVAGAGVINQNSDRISPRLFGWWTLLTATASWGLITWTSYVTSDVTPLPLLWVFLLAAYLCSFIVTFANQKYYWRRFYLLAWMPLVILEPFIQKNVSYKLAIIMNVMIMFIMCMVCHGELVLSKPSPAKLPTFYMALAVGGFAGGILANFLLPALLNFDFDRYLLLFVMSALTIAVPLLSRSKIYPVLLYPVIFSGIAFIGFKAWVHCDIKGIVHRQRNFYSSVRVVDDAIRRTLVHGRIIHGEQLLDPARKQIPSGYYWYPMNLITRFIRSESGGHPVHMANIGLGTGVLAAYGEPGDTIQFYELDPKVKDIAEKFFTYLKDSRASVNVKVGDGRAVLSREPDSLKFDFLLIDAFNGDAIPCHLLTLQAFEIYLHHLSDDGLLVFHITNRFVNLTQLLACAGLDSGMSSCVLRGKGDTRYVVLCRNHERMERLIAFGRDSCTKDAFVTVNGLKVRPETRAWTDDYINILSVLK